ncbi:MAG: TIGR00730 family Rossman fold protein [Gemmatimonadetes bacterium]|nr:TIGR00730 family Rossman fold protein [Gemmatimonadota bacterium]
MKRISVFCGSSYGRRDSYRAAAEAMGRLIAERGLGLVYGGGDVGLMGALADAALDAGGEVVGVIPEALADLELAHAGLTDLRIVDTMHARKAHIIEISDAFVALPGGIGTLEELAEVWTLAQLGYHGKPCAILNVDGYYDQLVAFLDHAVDHRFLGAEHRTMVIVETEPRTLLERMERYQSPTAPKWVDRR